MLWWPETDLNRRHGNFQSPALPTELPGRDVHAMVAAHPHGGQARADPDGEADASLDEGRQPARRSRSHKGRRAGTKPACLARTSQPSVPIKRNPFNSARARPRASSIKRQACRLRAAKARAAASPASTCTRKAASSSASGAWTRQEKSRAIKAASGRPAPLVTTSFQTAAGIHISTAKAGSRSNRPTLASRINGLASQMISNSRLPELMRQLFFGEVDD